MNKSNIYIYMLVAVIMFLAGTIAGNINLYSPSDQDNVMVSNEVEKNWLVKAHETSMPHRRFITLPLNNPDVVTAKDAVHMKPDDLVIGIVVNNQARAYPWWIMANYHMANDTINGTPVFVSLCEVCSGSAAFSPIIEELPDRPLSFRVCGVRGGTNEVCDYQTHSRWHPFGGLAHEGPLKGIALKRIPVFHEEWNEWARLYPETEVVFSSQMMRLRPHGAHMQTIGVPGIPILFRNTANMDDQRLPYNELVFGLMHKEPEKSRAYPINKLKRFGDFLQDDFHNKSILIIRQGKYRVAAYYRQIDDTLLEFTAVHKNPLILQDESGSQWNELGEAISGIHSGKKLTPVSGYLTEWYEWVTSFPHSEIATFRSPG